MIRCAFVLFFACLAAWLILKLSAWEMAPERETLAAAAIGTCLFLCPMIASVRDRTAGD